MPYIPHTQDDIAAMLNAIGADDIQHVFDEIPAALKNETLDKVEPAYSELAIKQHMQALAAKDANVLNFIGAGAYEHHIPSAVWQITTRGEIYTAYTPYQPEASQGSLQVIYEYQSMMCNLTGMDASNASLYDGASALAEAILMAVRSNRKSKSSTILVPKSLNPSYTKVLNSLCIPQGINLHMLDFDRSTGQTDVAQLSALEGQDITAIIIPQVNYFGVLEDFDALTAWANQNAAVSISVCNPLQLSVLKAPGDWGDVGVDIATGEGQPLGVPLSSGGPYYGYMTCKQQYVRQMPGRIVGKTTDADGKEGYVLTLQAREQHIRRSKATSNICTNQGLVVTASTIHMSIMGAEGLAETVKQSVQRAQQLRAGLLDMGFTPAFSGLDLYEYTLILPDGVDAESFHQAMDKARISFGINLPKSYGIANSILLCATETKTEQHIEAALAAVKLAVEV